MSLSGRTFTINENPSITYALCRIAVNFTDGTSSYSCFECDTVAIYYHPDLSGTSGPPIVVYENSEWQNASYRTITFTSEATEFVLGDDISNQAQFEAWLAENATEVGAEPEPVSNPVSVSKLLLGPKDELPAVTSSDNGKALVVIEGNWGAGNVDWDGITNKPSTYAPPLAADGTRGGVQVGYTQSGQNYPVQLSGEKMYVNVPWTDHYAWSDITGKPSAGSARQPVYFNNGTPTTANKTVAHYGDVGANGATTMNEVGRFHASAGMVYLRQNTNDNPSNGTIGSSDWHLYWDTCYESDPNGTNAWVAQIVNKAGTDQWWVRSRNGGTITDGTQWTAHWRHLVTAAQTGVGGTTTPVYVNENGEVVALSYTLGKSVPSDAVFTDHYAWADITGKPYMGHWNIGVGGTASWQKLGTFTGNQAANCWIHLITGAGYNGLVSQNAVLDIHLREGNYGSNPSPLNSTMFAATVLRYGQGASGFQVRVIGTAYNKAEVWVYMAAYSSGFYLVQSNYTNGWAHSGSMQAAEPSGVQQSIAHYDVTNSIMAYSSGSVAGNGTQATIPYPSGYTVANTMPIGCFLLTSGTRHDVTPVEVEYLDSSGIHVVNYGASSGQIAVALMKY